MKYILALVAIALLASAYAGIHAEEQRKRDCFKREATIVYTSTDSWICVNKAGRVVM